MIRPATDSDYPVIAGIFREVIIEGNSYDFAADANDEDLRAFWLPLHGACFVIEEGGRVVGAVVIRPDKPSSVANAAFIVAPSWRRRGLGRRLAEFALRHAELVGFTSMQFNFVIATNTAAVRLWTSLGFSIVGRHAAAFEHHEFGLVDALIMRRHLGSRG